MTTTTRRVRIHQAGSCFNGQAATVTGSDPTARTLTVVRDDDSTRTPHTLPAACTTPLPDQDATRGRLARARVGRDRPIWRETPVTPPAGGSGAARVLLVEPGVADDAAAFEAELADARTAGRAAHDRGDPCDPTLDPALSTIAHRRGRPGWRPRWRAAADEWRQGWRDAQRDTEPTVERTPNDPPDVNPTPAHDTRPVDALRATLDRHQRNEYGNCAVCRTPHLSTTGNGSMTVRYDPTPYPCPEVRTATDAASTWVGRRATTPGPDATVHPVR